MNENKSLRFWKWAVALLILCNICLISVIFPKPHLPFGPRPGQPRDFVIHELNFSPEQVKKYDSLIQQHQEAMRQLRIESANYHRQFFGNLGNDGQDPGNPDSLAQLIANNQKQIELATYNHFTAVRSICTNSQKAQFDKIIGDVTKMMSGPAHGNHQSPPPPGNHQGPPPPDGPPPPNQ